MLVLDDSGALVRVVTSSTADIDVQASVVDHTTATEVFRAKAQNTLITTATTTTIVSTPSSGDTRNVKWISIRNAHASNSNTVTVEMTDGTTAVELFKVTLAAGEVLVLNDAGAWFVYDALGGVKMGQTAATETAPGLVELASVAEMEAGTDVTRAVTPGNQHRHPSAAKFWVVFTGNSTTILASFNVTSITDGTTEATITIATDFSSANWCCVATAEGSATTVAAARLACCRAIAAGTIIVFCVDGAATTALQDPTRWHVAGYGDQ